MANEKLIAPKYKRLAAFLVDFILILLLWYLMTTKDLKRVDTLLESLDPLTEGALDRLAESIFKMATAFLLKWLFCQSLYFCSFPAILGNGKTLGKLLFRLSLLDAASLEEMSPSRLVLREFVGRTLLETLLILPGIVSLFMLLLSKDGKSLRDRLAGTVVVQDTRKLPKVWQRRWRLQIANLAWTSGSFSRKFMDFPTVVKPILTEKTARLPECCRSIPVPFRFINA